MQIVIGAVVFAAGALFGMWAILAGQASAKNRTTQRFQDALLKGMEGAARGQKSN